MIIIFSFFFKSAKSRMESRKSSAKSKDEELLKLPPINGGNPSGGSVDGDKDQEDEEMDIDKEEPKVEELDDYGKLVKAIKGKLYVVVKIFQSLLYNCECVQFWCRCT